MTHSMYSPPPKTTHKSTTNHSHNSSSTTTTTCCYFGDYIQNEEHEQEQEGHNHGLISLHLPQNDENYNYNVDHYSDNREMSIDDIAQLSSPRLKGLFYSPILTPIKLDLQSPKPNENENMDQEQEEEAEEEEEIFPAPLQLEESHVSSLEPFSCEDDQMEISFDCKQMEMIDDDENDEIALINIRDEYMEYQNGKFNNIGNGASGIVYKAFHYKSCKMVAIKKLRSKLQREINAFINEAALYQQFKNNQNIINVLHFGRDTEDAHLMMSLEYMDLGSCDKLNINQRFKNDIKLRENIVKHIIFSALNALKDVHNEGFVHNDIKPANILCNRYGEIKLSDFGTVSKLDLTRNHYLTKNCGTQKYQAPEKLTNIPKYDTKSGMIISSFCDSYICFF